MSPRARGSLPVAGNRANLLRPRKGGVVEQSGEYRIAAGRREVWAALNDPDVLCRCLDGCQSMERVAADHFRAKVKARVGPVRATFDADLVLADIDPPTSYTIQAQVKGGAAGFARGAAHVGLADDGADTTLTYRVDASIGGKLAQVGSRLIDGAARKMAEDFFARFREEMQKDAPSAAAVEPSPLADAGTSDPDHPPAGIGDPQARRTAADDRAVADSRTYESGGRWMIWLGAFVVLLLALVLVL